MHDNLGPLHGLRVLDFSTTPAGAQATQLFADFGAEVLQVEAPGGSVLRRRPAFPFLARGKKSIVLDLGDDADRVVAHALAAGADVVVETFRPGVMDGLGLGYDSVNEINPGVVYTSITGFGRSGPLADVQGYEALVMAAIGGYTTVGGMVTRPGPAFLSVPFCAYAASQTALHGMLAALHERERTGLGQRVEASLLQGIASLGTWNWFLRIITDKYPGAFTPQPPFTADKLPTSPLFFMLLICLTKDGRWLQFSQVQPHLFKALMKALELDWMYNDPEWKTAPVFEDEGKRAAFWEQLLAAAQRKTLAEWQEIFEQDHDVWAETMRRDSEILDHPQIQHLHAVVEVNDAERGAVRMPGPLVRLSSTPAQIVTGAPRLDEHGDQFRANPWPPHAAPATGGTVAGTGALAGVTILELGTFFAAPFGSNLLADLGARVIKVEPLEGEPMRTILPFPELGAVKVMQGKENISLDLGTPEGRVIVHELARRADIVLQSFRAGVAARQGVDEATLRAINPNLVYLNAPGYGSDGPCGNRPAYAPTIGAGTGFVMRNLGAAVPERPGMSIAEIRDNAVRLSVAGTTEFAQADGVSALGTATAMALGLLIRDRTGIAQGMLTTMLTSASHALCDDTTVWAGRPPTLSADPQLYGYGARYRMYECADAWLFLAAPMEGEWSRLTAALAGVVDLAGDARFADEAVRRANDDALADVLAATFRTETAAHWQALLHSHDVGAVEVDSGPPEKVLQSAEFGRASGLVVDVEHPTFGDHPRLAPLVTLSHPIASVGPGCLQGEHTDRVLAELGYDADAIAALHERKVVIG